MFAVGGTERMASRAARVQTAGGTASNTSTVAAKTKSSNGGAALSLSMYNNGVNNANTSQAATIKRSPPKLDESGHLRPEEVVRRTSSAIKTKECLLGNPPDNPIQVEVRYVELCECIILCFDFKLGKWSSSTFVPLEQGSYSRRSILLQIKSLTLSLLLLLVIVT
jgi:hypothetical protein